MKKKLYSILLAIFFIHQVVYANGMPAKYNQKPNGAFLPEKNNEIEIMEEELIFEVEPSLFIKNPISYLYTYPKGVPPSTGMNTYIKYKMRNTSARDSNIFILFPTLSFTSDLNIEFNSEKVQPIEEFGLSLDDYNKIETTRKYYKKYMDYFDSEEIKRLLLYQGSIELILFEVNFKANQVSDLSISYKERSGYDITQGKYPIYNFTYLLQPAKYWKDFKDLTIKVVLPENFLVNNSNLEFKEKKSFLKNTYYAEFGQLPKEDLKLEYMPIKQSIFRWPVRIALWIAILLIIKIYFFKIKKTRVC